MSEGQFERLSKPGRTKAVIYRGRNGPTFAVIPESGTAKLVFELKPDGRDLSWGEWIRRTGVEPTEQQLATAGLKVKEAGALVEGRQKVLVVPSESQLLDLLKSYIESDDGQMSHAQSRTQIEAAMDAYDDYRLTGAHAEIFGGFAEPRDYWVRSTRQRPDRLYPSKPINFWVNGNKASSGGWSGPAYSAAALHNSGFIIVDQDDKPVAPPEKDYLAKGAERARHLALNYFIEPARERGEAQVSIRIGDVSANLFPNHHYRNVWQALRGKPFQELARVPQPTQTGVDESPATVLTYQLVSIKGQSTMNPDTTSQTSTTNLILYGPPGTGKTYHTAWEAIRLCLGDADAERFRGDENRAALMAEYRRLMEDEKRIEFVTFHQSMSYEEFVEGLRPTTARSQDPDAPQQEELSSGFRLEAQDGIFKRISARAENDRGDAGDAGLDRTRRIYRLGLTGGDWRADLTKAIADKEMSWGFGGDTDWSAPEYEEWEAIKQRRKMDDAAVRGNHATVYGTWLVRSGAVEGSYVMLTVGRDRVVAFGRLAGDYQFTGSPEDGAARHSRPVDWIWHDPAGIDRSAFYGTPFTSFHPIYPLERDLIDWRALESLVLGPNAKPPNPRPHVLIIDEVNRANISKVFGELITLLEPDKRLGMENEIRLTLPYSKKRFGVPANLHIIATMNTADRSIALLDTALRRRFIFRELMPDPAVLSPDVDGINLQKLLRTINERIEYLFDREHQIGHAYFTGCTSRAMVAHVMRYKVIPLLAEYFYEDWTKVAAVLGDADQEHPRFLLREVITAPTGLNQDTSPGNRYRWRVRPHVRDDPNGGFIFTEFAA